MSLDTAQKDLLTALKVANWRTAGAAKFVQTTEAEELDADFLDEMKESCREAAERVEGAFRQLRSEVNGALRQTRVAEYLPRTTDPATGEITGETVTRATVSAGGYSADLDDLEAAVAARTSAVRAVRDGR